MDVVCADKTGTLTESGMQVPEVEELGRQGWSTVSPVCWPPWPPPTSRPNASMQAIAETLSLAAEQVVAANAPFKVGRKWSGVSFRDHTVTG